jgi:hypothetical protein
MSACPYFSEALDCAGVVVLPEAGCAGADDWEADGCAGAAVCAVAAAGVTDGDS